MTQDVLATEVQEVNIMAIRFDEARDQVGRCGREVGARKRSVWISAA